MQCDNCEDGYIHVVYGEEDYWDPCPCGGATENDNAHEDELRPRWEDDERDCEAPATEGT